MKNNIKNIILIVSLVGNLSIIYVGYKALGYRSHINYFLDKYTNVVNEFSGRSYYDLENRKLLSSITKDNSIVLIGTQVTEKWNIEDTSNMFVFINRGLPHQRLAGFLLRFKPDVIDLKPAYVIIEVSSYNFRPQNSVKEIQDYVSMMAELSKYNGIQPILTTVIPLREDAQDSLEKNEDYEYYPVMDSLQYYNKWLRNYAAQNDFILIDFNELLSDQNGFLPIKYSSGLIDLNEKGYEVISKYTLSVLHKELTRSK